MYEYRCKLRKVVDGDTVDIDVDLGFVFGYKMKELDCMVLIPPNQELAI